MAFAKEGAWGVVFVDGSGEVRTIRGHSYGDPVLAGKAYAATFKAKDPKAKFDPTVGKGLFPIITQADEDHFAAVEDTNRQKQAKEGKLTVQELTNGTPNMILEAAFHGSEDIASVDA